MVEKRDITKEGYVLSVKSRMLSVLFDELIDQVKAELEKLPETGEISKDEQNAKAAVISVTGDVIVHFENTIKDFKDLFNNLSANKGDNTAQEFDSIAIAKAGG